MSVLPIVVLIAVHELFGIRILAGSGEILLLSGPASLHIVNGFISLQEIRGWSPPGLLLLNSIIYGSALLLL